MTTNAVSEFTNTSFNFVQYNSAETKKIIENSNTNPQLKHTFKKILKESEKADLSGRYSIKGVSKEIKNYIQLNHVEGEEMDKLIISHFSTRDNVKAIYRHDKNEYWLIVEDAYSEETMECYNIYFDLVAKSNKMFELRALTAEELNGVMYMNPQKIY